MSLRELRVLVTNLPPDSATARAVRGHNWDDLHYMVAELLDVAKFHRVEWAMSHGAKPPKPTATTRPEVPDRSGGLKPDTHDLAPRALSDTDLARAAHQHVLELIGRSS